MRSHSSSASKSLVSVSESQEIGASGHIESGPTAECWYSSTDGTPSPLDNGLSEFGATLLSNPALLAEIDDLLIDLTAGVVEKYRHEIGGLIAQTVAGWDPAATSRRFELAVGRDLQFVRINGTLVGGLVGLLIYSITRLVR